LLLTPAYAYAYGATKRDSDTTYISASFIMLQSASASISSRVSLYLLSIIASLLLLLSSHTHTYTHTFALQFTVHPSEEVCISELVPRNELFTGEYNVSPPGSRVSINVFNPQSEPIYSRGTDEYGKFSAVAGNGGEYKVCIANNDGMGYDKYINLQLRSGLETKDYANVAKQSNLKPLEVELKRLEDLIGSIQIELQYLEGREKQQRSVNDATGSRVIWFTCISLLILCILSVVQITHLKGFFRRKHLID